MLSLRLGALPTLIGIPSSFLNSPSDAVTDNWLSTVAWLRFDAAILIIFLY